MFHQFRRAGKMHVAVVMENKNLQDPEYPVLLTSLPTQAPSFRCSTVIRPGRPVKNKTRRTVNSPGIMLLMIFIYLLLILSVHLNYQYFMRDHEDWIALVTVQQFRRREEYQTVLWEEEWVEGAVKEEKILPKGIDIKIFSVGIPKGNAYTNHRITEL